MRRSENFKIEVKETTCRRRNHSCVKDRFFLFKKILNFVAIRSKKRFSDWPQFTEPNFMWSCRA